MQFGNKTVKVCKNLQKKSLERNYKSRFLHARNWPSSHIYRHTGIVEGPFSPVLGCTHPSAPKPPHDCFDRQPHALEKHLRYQVAVGQPLLVEVSPQRRGDPPGWRSGEVWIPFCLLSWHLLCVRAAAEGGSHDRLLLLPFSFSTISSANANWGSNCALSTSCHLHHQYWCWW